MTVLLTRLLLPILFLIWQLLTLSPTHLAAVVVAAPSTTLADALTKVLFMGTPAQALAQAQRWGVDVVVVDKAGRLQASGGWA